MKVLVFGCGPAGLMAAHAAARLGDHDVMIVSKARKSHMRGAQYLHQPIPGASLSDPFLIDYRLMGTPEQYRERVYGDLGAMMLRPEDTSAATLTGVHPAWDIREAYDNLWDLYGGSVIDGDLSRPETIVKIHAWAKPDLVISTIPAPILCMAPDGVHQFYSQSIFSSDQEIYPTDDNTVVLCGDGTYAWYRAAKIHGWCTTEWPKQFRPPVPELVEVIKPILTNCDCYPYIHRMGRYGAWRKGVLSHHAYEETLQLLRKPHQEELFHA